VLSFLATNTLAGQVKGLHDFAPEDQPPLLPLLFYAFRIMAGIGFALFFLMLWTGWAAFRGALKIETIAAQKFLLGAWVASIPLGYIAVDMGWTVREVGRQPWVIYGLLRTSQGVSALSPASVGFTTVVYFLIDSLLLTTFIIFAGRMIHKGPDLTLPAPSRDRHRLTPEGHRATTGEI
jgi:cytochrome d ubiquinol oxidase subunit I